jgi:hypothetical protein
MPENAAYGKPTASYRRRVLADFGPRQQEMLCRAHTQGVDLDDPLATQARTTLLETAGLITTRTSRKGRTAWRVTETGRAIVVGHIPTLLHKRGVPPYTHQPHRALHAEPEVIT